MLELALIGFIALSVGGFLLGLLHPWLTGEAKTARPTGAPAAPLCPGCVPA